jgi:CheY-like chemotaxis protein
LRFGIESHDPLDTAAEASTDRRRTAESQVWRHVKDKNAQTRERPVMASRHSVLVVDDESAYVESVKDLLRQQYRVLGTTDPLEALRILEEQEVHIILTDQRMPNMSGIDLLRLVRDKHPGTIRLITSALFGPDGLRRSCNVGKNEENLFRYVGKTCPDDLMIALQRAVEEYELRAGRR